MTNKKTNSSARFTLDFINKTIIGTKASFNKAGKGISPIYEELAEKMKAHPDFVCEVKEQKKKAKKTKTTYFGMDFNFMETYITIQKNSNRLMMDYNAVMTFAKKTKRSVYPIMKKWFLREFDPNGEGFNMAKAKEEIFEAGLGEAILNAEPDNTEPDNTQFDIVA